MNQDLSHKQTSHPKTSEDAVKYTYAIYDIKTAMVYIDVQSEKIKALEDRNQRLVEALKPFPKLIQDYHKGLEDSHQAIGLGSYVVTLGDLKRAAAALSQNLPALEGETKAKEV